LPNWNEVLKQIQSESSKASIALDTVRRSYLAKLFEKTGRNVIAYYSGFLSKPGILLLDINDEDMNGFMMAVNKLDRTKGLDLILHTPGGSIASTESIVRYLHLMFDKNLRVVVPQVAMSAGTMIACSAREIVLGKQSSLGPIDPQLRGIPAQGVINEFKRALEEYKADHDSLVIWQSILQQYRPTFLGQCKQAIDWTNTFVADQLRSVMFEGDPEADTKANRIVQMLSDADEHKAHERHIPAAKCIEMGLRVRMLEDDNELQDLVLTVHHCYMHAIMNTAAFKIIENQNGITFVRNQTQPTR
jgi:hypothetical protein